MRYRHSLSVGFLVVLAASVTPYGAGVIPGHNNLPGDAARGGASCTVCHRGTVGASSTSTDLNLASYSLTAGQVVDGTLQVSSGVGSSNGGFAAENDGGSFVARSGTQLNTSGRAGQFLAHDSSGQNQRSWQVRYTAPTTPGVYRLWAVGMASSGSSTRGDTIAFTGNDGAATLATPVRVGVNAAGNSPYGQGCVGSYGNWPMLYSTTTPQIGTTYQMSVAGAATASSALFLIGLPRAAAVPLDVIGATGCGMWVDSQASLPALTSAGSSARGDGTATASLPIPNDSALVGAVLGAQAVIVDLANGRRLPITTTAGLALRLQ